MANMLSPRIKLGDYAGQYIVGNILGTIVALFVAVELQQGGVSAVVTAVAASATETVLWYSYVVLYYVGKGDSLGGAVRHLVSDFALAELLDTFFVRPVLMYIMPMFTHGQASGVVAATILADIVYTAVALNRQRHRQLG